MRKVILNLAVSLDGFIEGPNGEYDWCFDDQDYGLEAFYEDIDAIFIGRKSFEMVGAGTFADKKMYIFSDTLTATPGDNTAIISSANFDEKVDAIINESAGNIWLFGGAELVSALINKNMISELLLSVHPVILGAGKPLFTGLKERVDLVLAGQQSFSSGLVQLRYLMKPKFDMEMLKLL